MHAVLLQTWNIGKRGQQVFRSGTATFIGLGTVLGCLTVSMCQQWLLTFGYDSQFLLAMTLVFSFAFWCGQHWHKSQQKLTNRWSLLFLMFCATLWTILHPFWIDALTTFVGIVPRTILEDRLMQPIAALAISLLGLMIPGIVTATVVCEGTRLAGRFDFSSHRATALMAAGGACGLILNSLVLAPEFGVFLPAVLTSILGCLICAWAGRQSSVPTGNVAFADRELVVEKEIQSRRKSIGSIDSTRILRVGMAILVGAAFASTIRLVNQLMPQSMFISYTQFAGALLGVATGLGLTRRGSTAMENPCWGGMLAVATASVLFAIQPLLVDLSLWMNASFSSVIVLLAARSLLLMAVAYPFGLALSWIAVTKEDASEFNLISWGTPFTAGIGLAGFLLGGYVDQLPFMVACSTSIILAVGLLLGQTSGWSTSRWSLAGMASCLVLAMTLFLRNTVDDAPRTAKILFSAHSFVAYRSGWNIADLPQLDDVRLIHRREGRTGPLTLWRGRVAELYLREAGIPRSVISRDSTIVPQFPAEVLQVVYPMVLAERPVRLLFLGLSSGVPISTSLRFPVQEVVCLEGDKNLIEMVQGPLSRELGNNPLNDDRVTLRKISPELALMANSADRFDVIISSPLSSSMPDGSASFTQEFYQRAARQLCTNGIFCQRFECVDYGPEPVQLAMNALRTAFHRVVAIEMAAGDLLLMGANSDTAFVTANLPKRLESPHVSRILANCGLDWSALLNFPAYDHAAINEICDQSHGRGNSAMHGQLAARAPVEVMRWGDKQAEVQRLLTADRSSTAPFGTHELEPSKPLELEEHVSRRSRLIEWFDDTLPKDEMIRRLAEVVEQQKLVRENPDQHWWAYRRVLRKQLQDRPRSAIQQVKAVDEKKKLHPEDVHRRDYFVALGNAARQQKPSREQIAALEEYLEPYDPLVSYFGRQEAADLLARCGEDVAQEMEYRLHVIYFAPMADASVRNIAKALELVARHSEALSDSAVGFDILNGLIQTLRIRWEIRQNVKETSSQKILDDVDQCLIAVEKAMTTLDSLAMTSGVVSAQDWQTRKSVIDRMLLRPLRTYRTEVESRLFRGRAKTRSIIEESALPEMSELPE